MEAQLENLRVKAGEMVYSQIAARGIKDPAVLNSLLSVPRHHFVPQDQRQFAYGDTPLPIGMGQTISQPYMVALMTERLSVEPGHKILEIGTGCGYQAAVLAQMGARVYSVERIAGLVKIAARNLKQLGYNVRLLHGDGNSGFPDEAPFDRILVTAGGSLIPEKLQLQGAQFCRIVMPVNSGSGIERLLTRIIDDKVITDEWGELCRFVPLLDGLVN
jgi:protein-L-isoaspartate(D-aspartate) O-methyltransferase